MHADYSIAKGSNSLVCLGNVTLVSRSCTRLTSPNIFRMPSEDFAQKTRGKNGRILHKMTTNISVCQRETEVWQERLDKAQTTDRGILRKTLQADLTGPTFGSLNSHGLPALTAKQPITSFSANLSP